MRARGRVCLDTTMKKEEEEMLSFKFYLWLAIQDFSNPRGLVPASCETLANCLIRRYLSFDAFGLGKVNASQLLPHLPKGPLP